MSDWMVVAMSSVALVAGLVAVAMTIWVGQMEGVAGVETEALVRRLSVKRKKESTSTFQTE